MKHNPLSEDQIAAQFLWELGVYNFEVVKAAEETSKKGNLMGHVALKCFHPDGREQFVDDWLLPSFAYKYRHYFDSTDNMADYNAGEFEWPNHVGKTGKVKLGIQKGNPNPKGGMYKDRNCVEDYIKRSEFEKHPQTTPADKLAGDPDESPFG